MGLTGASQDDERTFCVLEEPVYCVPVEINPAVTIPSVFLQAARQSLLPPGRKSRVNLSLLPSPVTSGAQDNQSLLPSSTRLSKYSVRLKTIGQREKFLAIVLTVFIVAVVSLIISLIFMFCNQDTDVSGQPLETLEEESYRTSFSEYNFKKISTFQPTRDDTRSPCVGTCWTYSAFRFRSQCISGYCHCEGEFYNRRSCLPDVYGCKIEANVTEAEAFFGDKPQTVYTCSSANQKKTRNHVISTYGHHNSYTVHVDVTSTSPENRPITLILANYFPTRWRLNVREGIQISKILLMSNDHVTYSSVEFLDSSNTSVDPSRIRRLSIPVGYGDDRNGAHTVALLKYITKYFGPISSFSGAHYADRWDVSLDRQDRSVPYNKMI